MLVGALYALCVIMPSAAVAFGAGGHAVHCFTDEQLGLHVHQPAAAHGHAQAHRHDHLQMQMHAQMHVHADGTTHRHDEGHHPGTSDDNPAACCGLFGLTAMAVDPHVDLGAPLRNSSILPVSFEELTGRGPDRINRPPIALLPL